MQCVLSLVHACIGITIYWRLGLRLNPVIRHAMERDGVEYCSNGAILSCILATRVSSLCCEYAVVDQLDHGFLWIRWQRWLLSWDDRIIPRPTTMSTVMLLHFICMAHDDWTHITFWIELWTSSFSTWCEVGVLAWHVARLVLTERLRHMSIDLLLVWCNVRRLQLLPMLIERGWTLGTTHVAMPLSFFVLFPNQPVDIVCLIVQWIDFISSVTPLTTALHLHFTILAACVMRGVNKLYTVLEGTAACSVMTYWLIVIW